MFFTIQAIDNDYGVDSDLEYNLTSSLTDTFELRDSVDCEGCQDVVNTKIIDREQLGAESVYYIDIVVTETEPCVPHEGVQCQEAATQCTLQILDINDNSPVFSAASRDPRLAALSPPPGCPGWQDASSNFCRGRAALPSPL